MGLLTGFAPPLSSPPEELAGYRAERPAADPVEPDRLLAKHRREALALCHLDFLPDA